ncbi:coiled-coil domain protein domain-containing protein-containing protein [Trichoderma novae-zelandiae]
MPASLSSSSPKLPADTTPDDRDTHVAQDRPPPRRLRTPAKLVRLGVRNRRHGYLVKTPSYFDNLDHELADPVLYERLVKRFQNTAEREADSKAKGYGRILEADLVRGETKLSSVHQASEQHGSRSSSPAPVNSEMLGDGGAGTNAWDAEAENKEHGMQLWHAYLEARFVEGMDEEFDYRLVDDDYQYDTMAIQDAEDAWFDNEEPSWAECASQSPAARGETGIQDF